jgi:hypothetical protein
MSNYFSQLKLSIQCIVHKLKIEVHLD